MRLNSFVAIGLASMAAAATLDKRSYIADVIEPEASASHVNLGLSRRAATKPMDTPALSRLLKDVETGFKKINTALEKVTKENVNTQLDQVTGAARSLNEALNKDAAAIKASKPLGNVLTAVQLLQPALGALRGANATLLLMLEKRPIILEAKQEAKVREAFMTTKAGFALLVQALPSQLPDAAKQSIEQNTGQPLTITPAMVGPAIDGIIDTIMDLFTGKTPAPDFGTILGALSKGKGAKAPGGGAAGVMGSGSPSSASTSASSASTPAATPKAKDVGVKASAVGSKGLDKSGASSKTGKTGAKSAKGSKTTFVEVSTIEDHE